MHVVYGLVGLKMHCKIALVVRREGDGIRRYVHLGTGNYNADHRAPVHRSRPVHLRRRRFGADATDLFNYLTGYSRKSRLPQAAGGAA